MNNEVFAQLAEKCSSISKRLGTIKDDTRLSAISDQHKVVKTQIDTMFQLYGKIIARINHIQSLIDEAVARGQREKTLLNERGQSDEGRGR